MPIYQYLCPKCSLEFELKQSFTDDPIVACPKCHNGARRLFSPVPIVFKGSGFYVTDNNAAKGGLQNSVKENKTENKTRGKTQNKGEDKGGHDEGET